MIERFVEVFQESLDYLSELIENKRLFYVMKSQ